MWTKVHYLVLFAVLGAFAEVMTAYDHNEHMYIAAGVLVAWGQQLYVDFAYLQMPYLPLLYGGLYELLGVESYYYLLGKLISFALLCFTGVVLYLLGRRITRDTAIALAMVALFLLNRTIIVPASEVSNYIAPMACSILAVYLYHRATDAGDRVYWYLAASGLLIGIAVGFKLTYATTVLPFFCCIALFPPGNTERSIKSALYGLLAFSAGLLVAVLPVFAFMTDLPRFLFNNLGYHNVNTEWRALNGYQDVGTLASKFDYALDKLGRADNRALILAILISLVWRLRERYSGSSGLGRLSPGALLAFLLVAITLPTAMVPTPSWPQYYAMPVSFMFVCLMYACAPAGTGDCRRYRVLLLVLLVVGLGYRGPSMIQALFDLRDRDSWTALRAHDEAMGVRSAVLSNRPPTQQQTIVATLSPLLALESNLAIYPQLATGPFLYRIGDLLDERQRAQYVGTSERTIATLLDRHPPDAVIAFGEDALHDYAVSRGYRLFGTVRQLDRGEPAGSLFLPGFSGAAGADCREAGCDKPEWKTYHYAGSDSLSARYAGHPGKTD